MLTQVYSVCILVVGVLQEPAIHIWEDFNEKKQLPFMLSV